MSVHGTHCCKSHGCKYNDDDCPVVVGTEEQQFFCDECEIVSKLEGTKNVFVLSEQNGPEKIVFSLEEAKKEDYLYIDFFNEKGEHIPSLSMKRKEDGEYTTNF